MINPNATPGYARRQTDDSEDETTSQRANHNGTNVNARTHVTSLDKHGGQTPHCQPDRINRNNTNHYDRLERRSHSQNSQPQDNDRLTNDRDSPHINHTANRHQYLTNTRRPINTDERREYSPVLAHYDTEARGGTPGIVVDGLAYTSELENERPLIPHASTPP